MYHDQCIKSIRFFNTLDSHEPKVHSLIIDI